MSALLPGALALAALLLAGRRLGRRIASRRRSRRSLVKMIRSVMRDAERLLIRNVTAERRADSGLNGVGPSRDGGRGWAPSRLSDVDSGLLVISLHVLRQTVERHKVLLSAGERASFFEDLEDLESEQYDCEGKLLVLQRIYRTQPALLAGGGAASAGERQELGPGMQLDRR